MALRESLVVGGVVGRGCSLDYGLKVASGGRWWVVGRDEP